MFDLKVMIIVHVEQNTSIIDDICIHCSITNRTKVFIYNMNMQMRIVLLTFFTSF